MAAEENDSFMAPEAQALRYFAEGYACSQSILIVYGDLFGIERETAARLGAAFGGGVARRGETCGAVNAAIMALGSKYGHTSPDDLDSKEKTYRAVRTFISRFEARNGSIKCSQLLNLDISSPDGYQAARDQQLFSNRCPGFVSDAVVILNQLLTEG